MHTELDKAAKAASAYLERVESNPVTESPKLEKLRAVFNKPFSDQGIDGDQVIAELIQDVEPGLLHTAGSRFFGWVIGGSTPPTIAADWMCSVWDQNAAAYACSPSMAVIEEITGEWLKEILGLPATASFSFVTGCQMAHVVCLAAARHHVLEQAGWDVEAKGLFQAPPVRVLVGEHHETLLRAIRYLGLGSDSVVQVHKNNDGTINIGSLKQELASGNGIPTIVSLAAGDLNRGAFDDFDQACDAAHAAGAWVHVDGAFGLWVGASPQLKHLVKGIEKADSWATDSHKWLNVPYENGIGFIAHPESHRKAMHIQADYKIDEVGARDQVDWNPEWSKRARAVPVYVALRTMGRDGVADLIERSCRLTASMVERLRNVDCVEVLTRPIINQGLVRFLDPDGGSEEQHDAFTDQVIEQIQRDGVAWFGPTTWQGKRVMRISVSNWRTTEDDVQETVHAVTQAVNTVRGSAKV